MKTITSNTEAEVVEKRSKFIGNLYYVESVEQAEEKIKGNNTVIEQTVNQSPDENTASNTTTDETNTEDSNVTEETTTQENTENSGTGNNSAE